MRLSRQTHAPIRAIVAIALHVLLILAAISAKAQSADASHTLDIGIIVMPTKSQADAVIKELNAGADFAVLAKEKSIDATASDGGYMGNLDPSQLRGELRDALQGHAVGLLTSIVQLPSGFAILKVLPAAPQTEDLNPRRIQSLIATGAIHYGPAVSGFSEANTAFLHYRKPGASNNNLQEMCQTRRDSLQAAKAAVQSFINSDRSLGLGEDKAMEKIEGHSSMAQLYVYSGEMEKSIEEWKAAYQLALASSPGSLPNLEESLGASYLHLSEMENGIYSNSTDFDIWPPQHPGASFPRKDESKLAIQYFEKYLARQPADLEVKWLLNLAYSTIGEYPSGVPAAYLIPENDFRSPQSIGRFIDVAPATGLNLMRGAGGVIADDFENNGLLDIVSSSQDLCDPMHYFHNNGDGTFTDRSKEAGLLNQLGGLNLAQADYNNDGCVDFLVLRGGWEFPQRRSLMRNNCDGTFTDVTDESGLGAPLTASQSAKWADIDNDGLLDLFVVSEKAPSLLFHNKGDGTFEEIGHAAGIDRIAFSKAVTAADYDHDGFVDFYVTNQNGVNFLYHNNGDKTFTEVARQAGVQGPTFSFATWFFDYDNDGWPDILVNSYLPGVDETMKTYLGLPHNAETMKLYRNKHDGTFDDVSAKVGLDKVFMPMGANFGDVDNDGFLDLYLGSGNPSITSVLPHVLLRNNQGNSFVDITQSSGTGEIHKGHAIVFADLGRQGHEDIVSNNGGAIPADKHALRLFQNPGNANDWLNVKLVGVKSNRSAIGAQIKVTVQDGDAPPRSIYRTVGQTSSFGSNPLEQHIGLGPNAHAITLDLRWPASDTSQHFTNIQKNQFLEIKESATTYTHLERHPFQLGKHP